jgi:hypothetical protein
MFSNSKISRRLIVLISVFTLTIVSIGGVTLIGMTGMVADTKTLNVKTAEATAFSRIAGSVRYHMLDVGQQLSAGTLDWPQAERLLTAGSEEFEQLWQAQLAAIAVDPKNREFFDDAFGLEVEQVRQGYAAMAALVAARDFDRILVWGITDARGFDRGSGDLRRKRPARECLPDGDCPGYSHRFAGRHHPRFRGLLVDQWSDCDHIGYGEESCRG